MTNPWDAPPGTRRSTDLEDAKTAAAAGDIALAVFYLGRHHGGVLENLWQFVGDQKISSTEPGKLRQIPQNRQ